MSFMRLSSRKGATNIPVQSYVAGNPGILLKLTLDFAPSMCLRGPARARTAQPRWDMEDWHMQSIFGDSIGYANRIARAGD
jgi:hypothetical protein